MDLQENLNETVNPSGETASNPSLETTLTETTGELEPSQETLDNVQIEHTITDQDLENNPGLVDEGVETGDVVILPPVIDTVDESLLSTTEPSSTNFVGSYSKTFINEKGETVTKYYNENGSVIKTEITKYELK